MSESAMRQWAVQDALRPWGAIALENLLSSGDVDVIWRNGGAELKQIPKRPPDGAVVPVGHFTREQRARIIWMWRRRWRVVVLFRMEKTWFLFPGDWAARHLGFEDEETLRKGAGDVWEGRPTPKQLRVALTRGIYRGSTSTEG